MKRKTLEQTNSEKEEKQERDIKRSCCDTSIGETKNRWRITKVISGGQTGADQAALRAAKQHNLQTGGCAALRFQTSRGPNPLLRDVYGLQEITMNTGSRSVTHSYVERSKRNVDDSDATIAFRVRSSPGTDKTIGYTFSKTWRYLSKSEKDKVDALSKCCYRPCLVIKDTTSSNTDVAVKQILDFIKSVRPLCINVCGHRNDGTKESAHYESNVEEILLAVFAKLASL